MYIDPPFDSRADYKKKIKIRSKSAINDISSFEEKQYADIWINDEYLQFMYERLILIRELMSEQSVIFLHCDWHKSHQLRNILDEIFGYKNIVNELCWQRFNFRADGKKFGSVHDNILFYRKTDSYIYNQQYWPLKEEYIKSHFKEDDAGKLFRLDNLTAPLHADTGKPLFFGEQLIYPPAGAMWRYAQDGITKLWEAGRIVIPDGGGVPQVVRYLDESPGQAIHSVCLDSTGHCNAL